MTNHIDGLGDSAPRPGNYLVLVNTPKVEAKAEPEVPPCKEPKEIEPVNPKNYTGLFIGLRNLVSPTIGLRKFVNWASIDSPGSEIENSRNALLVNHSLADSFEDLSKNYSQKGFDLISLLKNLLVSAKDFNEKVLVIKMLTSLEREEELSCEYLIPVLEKRPGFKNLNANHEFCCKFLTLQDEFNLKRILESLHYNEVTNINDFAKSLIKIADPDFIIETLIEASKIDVSSEADEAKEAVRKEQAQRIALSIIENITEGQFVLSQKNVQNLYKISANLDISKKLSEILGNNFPQDAPAIFKEQMYDDSDESETGRRRRFHAIYHYIKAAGANGVPTLKDFIETEKDPFLVANVVYALANFCDIDGKRTLSAIIVNQIRENKTSLVLASISQLIKAGEPYIDILKNILVRSYEKGSDLKQAYINLSNTEFGKIYKDTKDGLWTFDLNKEYHPNLVTDMISNIGMETFLRWAAYGEGKNDHEAKNFRKNALAILNYAWEINSEKMRELTLEATTFATEETLSSFYGLSGMKELAKN